MLLKKEKTVSMLFTGGDLIEKEKTVSMSFTGGDLRWGSPVGMFLKKEKTVGKSPPGILLNYT